METGRLKTEFYILKCYQIFHLILIVLILTCHFITHTQYLFIYQSLIFGFYVGVFLFVVIFINSLVSYILILRKKYTPTLLNKFKNIMLYMTVLCIMKGIILTVVYWQNYPNYESFISNCPFIFSQEKMSKLIEKTKSNKIKDTCQIKRCFYNNENSFEEITNNNKITKYNYICNFNAQNSYYQNKKNDLVCSYISSYSVNNYYNPKKLSYFTTCEKHINFFWCSTKNKRHEKKFNMGENFICPNSFKKYRILILGILFPLIDIGADLVVISFIYCQYNIIIRLINLRNILGERYTPSSLNSTKDSSIVYNDNNNMDILPQLNNMQTEIYISQNLLNNNYTTNNNNYFNFNEITINNNKEIKNIKEIFSDTEQNGNKKELSESKNVLINSKNELMGLKINKAKNINIKK